MQGRRDDRVGWLALYAVTVALEVPVMIARYLAAFVVAAVALRATGGDGASAAGWAKLAAVLPALWSLAALVNPAGSGWWWRQRMGGREPSRREYLAYRDALRDIEAGTMILLPTPKRWFVVDERSCDAAVCGDALMVSRGLLESPHLPAVLAHELGHLQGIDARLTAAVNRLVIDRPERPRANPEETALHASVPVSASPSPTLARRLMRWAARMTIALLRGGVGLRLTAPAWGAVWREQEYEADRFAARIGQAEELADFLELEALVHDHPIPLVWLTDHTHPPAELRIDRLRAEADRPRPELAA